MSYHFIKLGVKLKIVKFLVIRRTLAVFMPNYKKGSFVIFTESLPNLCPITIVGLGHQAQLSKLLAEWFLATVICLATSLFFEPQLLISWLYK